MKKIVLLILLLAGFKSFSQSAFKYQARVNMMPISNFYYASAYRLGIETVKKNWNFGFDVLGYNASKLTTSSYFTDSSDLKRKNNLQSIFVSGFAINVMKAIQFKTNNNRLLFGVQGFVGRSVQTNSISTEIYDTSHKVWPGYSPTSDYNWQVNDASKITEKHGSKLAFGITPFIRMELIINKRFTFTPELMLPVIFMNNAGGSSSIDFNEGFNFCLGYKFGKMNS